MPETPYTYPTSARGDVVETLHGHQIADPYRWLEDADSAETAKWVDDQAAFAEEFLSSIESRDWFRDAARSFVLRPKLGTPKRESGWWLRYENDGTQAQDVLVGAQSLEALEAGQGLVLVDPNTLSQDGTTSLSGAYVSPDGTLLATSISEGGSDWNQFATVNLETGETSSDKVVGKFHHPVWLPDSQSFLYVDFPDSGRASGTETKAQSGGHLKIHRLGTEPSDDIDVLNFPGEPRKMMYSDLFAAGPEAGDTAWLAVHIGIGTESKNELWVAPITQSESGESVIGDFIKLVSEPTAAWYAIAVRDQKLIVQTDSEAPRGRVVSFDLANPEAPPAEIIAESEGTLEGVAVASAGIIASHLIDAVPRLSQYGFDGAGPREIDITCGAVVALRGDVENAEVYIGVTSVTSAEQAWVFNTVTHELRALQSSGEGVTVEFVQKRGRATSKDGTEVPYFLLYPKGHDLTKPAPTFLYGYGGFNVPVLADFRPGWGTWLAAGGVLVIANLRGGGEFGTDWYEGGKLANKQNVFDDFIGVAEHLTAEGITTADQLAIHGRSNGGLLVGAAMTQRPELFAAAIPQVGVLDMLRFHKFTVGAAWISDYGDPEVAEDFETALAYSPLHNLKEGVSYPATMVVTGDHDDRVVPAHSHKFTAKAQAVAQADPDRPIISRIEKSTGHGSGKPKSMLADEWGDVMAFAAHFTRLAPDHNS